MSNISHADQVAAIQREIGMREKLYPRWVKQGKLTQANADLEMARLKAVERTLVFGFLDYEAGVRRRTQKAMLNTITPFLHSSKIPKIEKLLWGKAYCQRCEREVETIDRGETCGVCKLVL